MKYSDFPYTPFSAELGDRLRDLGDVAVDFHFREDARDAAFFVDQKGRSLDTHVVHAVELFLLPDAISVGDRVTFIDEKVVRQRVFLTKLPVRLRAVGTDSKDCCVELPEPGKGVAEIARLTRSARGVVFRIEEENNLAPAQRRERHARAFVRLEIEIRCSLSNSDQSVLVIRD